MGKKADYGLGHAAFLEYVRAIVAHPHYAKMPDTYKDDGTVQWEAPSNRLSGKYKDTNLRRRAWWAGEATKLGMSPSGDTAWLSRTAKMIHPTKRKPCKKCGLEMDLRYVYPNAVLIRRLLALPFLNGIDQIDPLEDIVSLVRRLYQSHGDEMLRALPHLLKAKGITMPSTPMGIDAWVNWLETAYVPNEPSMLSPGAMSNAPDRFDGFHSFNLCHRGSADTGRHKANMASYITDRRVFELWVDGDWIAADRLMGRIRAEVMFQKAGCFYASVHAKNPPVGNSSADHIGPISLGFCHRDEFQLLCISCNSTKNNRIRVEDVQRLIAVETTQNPVISWYARSLWDLRKACVVDEDTALRLAKMLRDNRYTYMMLLSHIYDAGYVAFLCSLLNLQYADREVEDLKNLRLVGHLTAHDGIVSSPRTTKYVLQQKARRIRIAFTSLRQYLKKAARNALRVTGPQIDAELEAAIVALGREPAAVLELDSEIRNILAARVIKEGELRNVVHRIELVLKTRNGAFQETREHLEKAMSLVATELDGKWNDPRYNRDLDLTDF